MNKSEMFDKALSMLSNDMDNVEGNAALSHSMDDCPDPLTCGQHDSETGLNLAPEEGAPSVKIEISKWGLPSLDGVPSPDDKGEEGQDMSPEDQEMLEKLLGKK